MRKFYFLQMTHTRTCESSEMAVSEIGLAPSTINSGNTGTESTERKCDVRLRHTWMRPLEGEGRMDLVLAPSGRICSLFTLLSLN